MIMKKLMDNLYLIRINKNKRPATVNYLPGEKVYEETVIKHKGIELRVWDPFRSKFAAAIVKGYRNIPFDKNSHMLYLGAANGTTISHFSDIITNGLLYGIEFSFRAMRDLKMLSEKRQNIIPVLADARKPETYQDIVSNVNIIYQDIAQPDQAEILLKNIDYYMESGIAILMVKARSSDVTRKPSDVFREEAEKLKDAGLKIIENRKLSPFEKDHAMIVAEIR